MSQKRDFKDPRPPRVSMVPLFQAPGGRFLVCVQISPRYVTVCPFPVQTFGDLQQSGHLYYYKSLRVLQSNQSILHPPPSQSMCLKCFMVLLCTLNDIRSFESSNSPCIFPLILWQDRTSTKVCISPSVTICLVDVFPACPWSFGNRVPPRTIVSEWEGLRQGKSRLRPSLRYTGGRSFVVLWTPIKVLQF